MSRISGYVFVSIVTILFVFGDASARAQDEEAYPGFLVVSLNGSFEIPDVSEHCQSSDNGGCHDNRCGCKKKKRHDKKQCTCELPSGSAIVLVPIGDFVAGYDVRNTYFVSDGTVVSDALADAIAAAGDIEELNGNQATIIGAVDTLGPNSIHLLTPDPGAVPPQVQEAFFNAAPFLDFLPPEEYPMTTVDLAVFIYEHQEPAMATLQEILDSLFETEATLECTTCEAEGDLFPHDPEEDDPLLRYTIRFNEDGEVSVEGCTLVEVDLKPGSSSTNPINLGSEGVTPLVILSVVGQRYIDGVLTDLVFFDPSDVDPDTVRLGATHEHGETAGWAGAAPDKYSYEDKNGDGVADLVLHFKTEDLVDEDLGALTEDSTEVELHGETYGGGCVEGTDHVTIVPAN